MLNCTCDNEPTICGNPEHDMVDHQCCWMCCPTCQEECLDPTEYGYCDECNKPYSLASHFDHNPETGLHYECETGWFCIDLSGAMKEELERVLFDILFENKYGHNYNQVVLLDALNVIEQAERRVLDKF